MSVSIERDAVGVLVWLAGISAGCGGPAVEPDPDPDPAPASIVMPNTLRLRAGQTQQLSVVVLDAAGAQLSGIAVSFASDDDGVAMVTPGGLVTAVAAGSATITASAGEVSADVSALIRRVPPLGVVASPQVGGCPYGIALAGSGTGFVTQFCSTTVTRFNVAGPTLTGTASVGMAPPHVAIAPNGATAYVINQLSGTLMVVDIATNTAVDTIPLGGDEGYNLLVAPNGARVYLTTSGGTVYAMNAATHALEDTVQVPPYANGLALHPTQPVLYVSSIFAASVTAINTTTFTPIRTYSVGGQLQRIAVAPSGLELYAANINSMSIVDLQSGIVTPLAMGSETIGLALDALGEYVYVGVPAQGRVAVVDLVERAVFGDITTGGDPRNIAIGADGTVVIANQDGWFDVVR